MNETFSEMLDDDKFFRWLAKSLDYKTSRLKKILESYRQEMKSRWHTLSDNQTSRNFWLDETISIPSTNRRSGQHEIRIGKVQYMQEYKHLKNIHYENCKKKMLY